MKFTLNIDTSGSAFDADPLELPRVIKNVANRVGKGDALAMGKAVDANGNTCGIWTITEGGEVEGH